MECKKIEVEEEGEEDEEKESKGPQRSIDSQSVSQIDSIIKIVSQSYRYNVLYIPTHP